MPLTKMLQRAHKGPDDIVVEGMVDDIERECVLGAALEAAQLSRSFQIFDISVIPV